MPNYGTYAICPYFQSEDPTTIKCEGIVQLIQAEALYHVRFPNKECKKHFMRCYCENNDNWDKCPYAALLESTYDEAGNVTKAKVKRRILIRRNPDKKIEIDGQLKLF